MFKLLSQKDYNYVISFNSYEAYAINWASNNTTSNSTMFLLLELLEKYIDSIKPTNLNDYLIWLDKEKGLIIDVLDLNVSVITMLEHDINLYNEQGFLKFRKIDNEIKLLD